MNILSFLKKSSYVIISNLLSLLISILVILVIPKIIGVEDYGYWQLYLFYVSYVGFLHLGWIDGIYLKYAGKEYQELEIQKFYSQFISLFVFQALIAIGLYFFSHLLESDENKLFIFTMLAFTLIFNNVRFLFIYILQTTNRIKESAYITITDRIVYVLFLILLIVWKKNHYQVMIVADMIGRALSLCLAIYFCKELALQKLTLFKLDRTEILDNIKVGSSLMFSNICSMLIIGIFRFGIEYKWDISTFGKVSLIFSISAFLMVFINAIGVVLFPMLKNMQKSDMEKFFARARDLFVFIMFAMLLCYYPLKLILSMWLPDYADSMIYMSIIFPIAVYEGKMALLLNTYFKALRLEKNMLIINFVVMLLSFVFTVITVFAFKNIMSVMLAIMALLMLRSIAFEYVLSKVINIGSFKGNVFEIILTISFIFFNLMLSLDYAFVGYLTTYFLYLFVLKKNVITYFKKRGGE